MFDCSICYEECKDKNKVGCPKCQQEVCKACVKTHLLSIEGNPKCFNPMCNMEWNRVFCIEKLTMNFMNKKLKPKKEEFLLEKEKARIPEILPKVPVYKKICDLEDHCTVLKDELDNSKDKLTKGDEERVEALKVVYNMDGIVRCSTQLNYILKQAFGVGEFRTSFKVAEKDCVLPLLDPKKDSEVPFTYIKNQIKKSRKLEIGEKSPSYDKLLKGEFPECKHCGKNVVTSIYKKIYTCYMYDRVSNSHKFLKKLMTKNELEEMSLLLFCRTTRERYGNMLDAFTIMKKQMKTERLNLQSCIREQKRNIIVHQHKINRLKDKKAPVEEEEKVEIVRKCPQNDCEGYLAKWKCTLCETKVCRHCFEIKEMDHECLKENLDTANLIRKETKHCPNCSVSIYKTQGCDQMWCTCCKIAFSWRTGKRVNGVIHNPHYYEWKKNGGGEIRNPGDIVCGGLVSHATMSEYIRNLRINKITKSDYELLCCIETVLSNMHRATRHNNHVFIHPLRVACQNEVDNEDILLKYVTNKIADKKFKSMLFSREKKREGKLAKLHLYELMNTYMTEQLNYLVNCFDMKNLINKLNEIEKFRLYYNKSLVKIGYNYSMSIYLISMLWEYKLVKKIKKSDLIAKVEEVDYTNMYENFQVETEGFCCLN